MYRIMRFYLSSYKFGRDFNDFKKLLPSNLKLAYIPNALDPYDDLSTRPRDLQVIVEMKQKFMEEEVNIEIEFVDLRDYLDNSIELELKLSQFGIIWVRGGNVYVLQKTIERSGFDRIIRKWFQERKDLLYAGYSAGICILAKSLEGIHLMDDLTQTIYGELKPITEGIGILNYLIIPHYQSPGHPETEFADICIEYMKQHKLPYKTLRDGEVIII
jgi:dipeptidase E